MKRHFLAIALMACASLAVACYETVATPFRMAAAALKDFAIGALKLTGTGGSGCIDLNPISIKQAKAFVLRLVKRDRPVITSSWRMCPSA